VTTANTEGQILAATYSTDETTAANLPIGTWASQYFRTMARVIVPAAAGDSLKIEGRARVTADMPAPRYTVGISTSFMGYDCDDEQGSSGPWWPLDTSTGDNVTPDRHHMPIVLAGFYQVPADWPTGHRLVVVLRSDAASTAARSGDCVTVDKLTRLTVDRWTNSL
jgi:hypothetical protein